MFVLSADFDGTKNFKINYCERQGTKTIRFFEGETTYDWWTVFPNCSPVSMESAPAPWPNPTPFGP
jgi:hypothetical protein